jgi:hypothetical protein
VQEQTRVVGLIRRMAARVTTPFRRVQIRAIVLARKADLGHARTVCTRFCPSDAALTAAAPGKKIQTNADFRSPFAQTTRAPVTKRWIVRSQNIVQDLFVSLKVATTPKLPQPRGNKSTCTDTRSFRERRSLDQQKTRRRVDHSIPFALVTRDVNVAWEGLKFGVKADIVSVDLTPS